MGGGQGNKIFAAVLIAGIVGMAAGILSDEIFHVKKLDKNAFPIEVTNATPAAGAPAAPAVLEPIAPLMAAADAAHGQDVAKLCGACHSFDKGGANRVGPNLWNVFGAPKAGRPTGFAYSDAIKAKGGDWDPEELNKFLAAPQQDIPGTKMGFAGLKKPKDRADVISYLQKQHD